jgi:hypothetical protein
MMLDMLISMPSLWLEHWLGHRHAAQQDIGKELEESTVLFLLIFVLQTTNHMPV